MAEKKKPAPKKKPEGYFGKAEKDIKELMKKYGVKTLAELERVLYKK